MLEVLASVGVQATDVTWLDIEGSPVRSYLNCPLTQLRQSIGSSLRQAETLQQSFVIRPRSASALLIQLDDFTAERAERIAPHAFMTVCTSPGNYQLWLAVTDGPKENEKEAAKLFRTRVRRGAGADHSATGATRIAGSLNFKTKYAPDFPIVALGQVSPGHLTTVAALEHAGLIAQELPQPPASVPPYTAPPARSGTRQWPDYQQTLRGAPRKGDGTPDRSLADFMFCKWAVQRGWSVEETAEKLAEVSAKTQERIRVKGDQGYALLTARNAAAAVERDRDRRVVLKPAARP
jgi:RepB DNA-primase N-terminal domain